MDPSLRAQMEALRAGELTNARRLQSRVAELEHELAVVRNQQQSIGQIPHPGHRAALLPVPSSLSPHPRSRSPYASRSPLQSPPYSSAVQVNMMTCDLTRKAAQFLQKSTQLVDHAQSSRIHAINQSATQAPFTASPEHKPSVTSHRIHRVERMVGASATEHSDSVAAPVLCQPHFRPPPVTYHQLQPASCRTPQPPTAMERPPLSLPVYQQQHPLLPAVPLLNSPPPASHQSPVYPPLEQPIEEHLTPQWRAHHCIDLQHNDSNILQSSSPCSLGNQLSQWHARSPHGAGAPVLRRSMRELNSAYGKLLLSTQHSPPQQFTVPAPTQSPVHTASRTGSTATVDASKQPRSSLGDLQTELDALSKSKVERTDHDQIVSLAAAAARRNEALTDDSASDHELDQIQTELNEFLQTKVRRAGRDEILASATVAAPSGAACSSTATAQPVMSSGGAQPVNATASPHPLHRAASLESCTQGAPLGIPHLIHWQESPERVRQQCSISAAIERRKMQAASSAKSNKSSLQGQVMQKDGADLIESDSQRHASELVRSARNLVDSKLSRESAAHEQSTLREQLKAERSSLNVSLQGLESRVVQAFRSDIRGRWEKADQEGWSSGVMFGL